jgi:RNA:NAD 2'-phosphotransferase (TPT1/KptA family)
MPDRDNTVFTVAWGDTPEAAVHNAKIKFLHARFKRTNDRATLAELAELDPPAGDKAVGKAIADVLRDKKPDSKIENDEEYRWIDRVFNHFREEGHGVDDSYAKIAEIFFPNDERNEAKPIESIRKQHGRWLKKLGQNF